MKTVSPEKQLAAFLAKYDPAIIAKAKAIRKAMRRRLPGALELVYDNYNALVIGYGPTEKAGDAIFSVVLYPRWVTLFFLQGAGLPDPQRLLKGSGKVARHIVLDGAADLDKPAIRALMDHALARARTPIEPGGRHKLVIKSVSEAQRPRRPVS